MSSNYEIPLSGDAEAFSIALNGTTYDLTFQWRNADQGGWIMDIADSSGGAIVSGIPLVTGANLLEQYGYLGIAGGAALYIANSAGGDSAPAFSNLGSDTHLVLAVS